MAEHQALTGSRMAIRVVSSIIKDAWPVVVIGGAVRDWWIDRDPIDVDVYILGGDVPTMAQLFAAWRPRILPYKRRRELVAEMTVPQLGNVQVVAAPDKTCIDDFLESCDWNVSAFASDGNELWGNPDCVGPLKPLLLNKVSNPISTLNRGFLFADRFDMKFAYTDVIELCRQAIARHERRTTQKVKR